MSSSNTTKPFDPFTQVFTIKMADGTPLNVSMADVDSFQFYNTKIGVNYASQLGASLILLVIILLITKPEKRRAPVFFLNVTSLFVNVCRNLCQILYFTSAFTETFAYLANDFSRVPRSDYATSIAGTVLTLILLICVEASLILQTQVVCTTLRSVHRRLILAASIIVALVAIGFRFALVVLMCEYILNADGFGAYRWLGSDTNIAITTSIVFFCIIFITKLGFAIRQRHQLGLKQFGPMQVIFIMGCQTLIVPVIFAILQYFTSVPEFGSLVLTTVAIFLPLSSIWAGSSVDRTEQSQTTIRRKLFNNLNSHNSGSTGADTYNDRKGSAATTVGGVVGGTTTTNIRNSPVHEAGELEEDRALDRDLEKAGIRVDRLFGATHVRK